MSHDHNSPPGTPRKAPPAPPRRPPPPSGRAQEAESQAIPPSAPQSSSQAGPPPASQPVNRFVASGDPTPPLPTVNPFLESSDQAGSAPQQQAVPQQDAHPAAGQASPGQPAAGQASSGQTGAGRGATPDPRVRRPAVESPQVLDAHAEFRQGRWKRPVLYAAAAACVVGGIFLLGGGEEPNANVAAPIEAKREPASVIGASLAPERTTLKEETAQDHKDAFERTERAARRKAEGETPVAPADIPSESEFARAFKDSAKK